MASRRTLGIELDAAAKRTQKALKAISKASTDAVSLRTKALYGALGFCAGTGVTFGALAAASLLIYAPFLVPLAGVCGIIGGVLAGRDATDWDNERTEELIDQAWRLRQREVKDLHASLKIAPQTGPVRAGLSQELAALAVATPQELCARYALAMPEPMARRDRTLAAPVLHQRALPGPGQGAAMSTLSDMRVPAEPDR
ncbi:hypothetical protein ACVMIX_006640 [Rhizobium leguminosarum]